MALAVRSLRSSLVRMSSFAGGSVRIVRRMYPAVSVHRPSGGNAFQTQLAGSFDWFLPADGAEFIFWIIALSGLAFDAEL